MARLKNNIIKYWSSQRVWNSAKRYSKLVPGALESHAHWIPCVALMQTGSLHVLPILGYFFPARSAIGDPHVHLAPFRIPRFFPPSGIGFTHDAQID